MMFNRTYDVIDVEAADELAYELTQKSWCLCTGFRLDGYLFLNDSTSEDGAGEWGVVRESDMRQVESITFGWMNRAAAQLCIEQAIAGEMTERMGTVERKRIQTPAEHGRCRYCG